MKSIDAMCWPVFIPFSSLTPRAAKASSQVFLQCLPPIAAPPKCQLRQGSDALDTVVPSAINALGIDDIFLRLKSSHQNPLE